VGCGRWDGIEGEKEEKIYHVWIDAYMGCYGGRMVFLHAVLGIDLRTSTDWLVERITSSLFSRWVVGWWAVSLH